MRSHSLDATQDRKAEDCCQVLYTTKYPCYLRPQPHYRYGGKRECDRFTLLDLGGNFLHLGSMILPSFRRVTLALALLSATLLSAPVGSMEQRAGATGLEASTLGSLPVARTGSTAPVVRQGQVPRNDGTTFDASPLTSPPGEVVLLQIAIDHLSATLPPQASEPPVRPHSERLPYQPNAPPAVA